MKLTTGIVFLAMAAGTALGQNPTVINNTKVTLQAAQASGSPAQKSAPAAKISAKAAPKAKPAAAHQKSQPKQQIAVENQKKPAEAKSDAPTQVNLASRRDPFVSPVVNRSMIGSGCSTGKRCLAIDQINLKGVVKADSGMIAVVVNSLNKAYFLRENDPVFNGFVVKITGDSIIFKETVQDRLGKPSMREVTKKITTSAV
jgi:Tfp pilus assembly protein PilP